MDMKVNDMPLSKYMSGFSDNGLLKMQKGIVRVLKIDDETPEGQEKVYLVRELSDWKEWGNALEAELDNRKVKYEKIPW